MIYSALNGYVIHQGMVTPFNKGCLAEATHTASDSCSDCTAGHVYDDNMLPPRYPRRASKTYMRDDEASYKVCIDLCYPRDQTGRASCVRCADNMRALHPCRKRENPFRYGDEAVSQKLQWCSVHDSS
jgi:hypothetical protein